MKKRSIVMAMAALMMVSAVTGCTSKAVSSDGTANLLEVCRVPRSYQAVADAMKAKGLGLKSTNALSSLPVHPSALLAKLESTGGLVWDEGWKLTSAGAAALKAAGRTV